MNTLSFCANQFAHDLADALRVSPETTLLKLSHWFSADAMSCSQSQMRLEGADDAIR